MARNANVIWIGSREEVDESLLSIRKSLPTMTRAMYDAICELADDRLVRALPRSRSGRVLQLLVERGIAEKVPAGWVMTAIGYSVYTQWQKSGWRNSG